MSVFVTLAIAALLGLIPANIAKKKGHSFGLWWFYGWMLFIVAIIHVQFIEDYNAPKKEAAPALSTADELTKYRDLADRGAITEAEFQEKKRQLLGSSADAESASSAPSGYSSPIYQDPYLSDDPISTTAWSGRSAQPVIYCTGGQLLNHKVRVDMGTVTVGRATGCTVRFEDGTPGVSGRHCAISWDTGRQEFVVQDLGSSYGTFLKNGTRLFSSQPYYVQSGEVLRLGGSSASLRLEKE